MMEALSLEKHFRNYNLPGGDEQIKFKHHDIVRLPPKQLIKAAKEANYVVKIDPLEPENEKLLRLSRTFNKNPKLTAVQLQSDLQDFENTTNSDFNTEFVRQVREEEMKLE